MKARKPANPAPMTKAEVAEWIRVRKEALAGVTTAEIDRMTEEALSRIDQEAAYKDSLATLKRYGIEPEPSARRRTN